MKRLSILIIAALIFGVYYFDLTNYLSLDYLKNEQAQLQALIENNFLAAAVLFFIIYILVTALSIPGAAILTLAGGALFGLWTGVLIVSFASTIGATIAFLASRYLLQDYVQKKFSSKLDAINRGVEKEGGFYLFSLRLIPVFPFFAINLLFGLTKIKVSTFFIASQIGMLAGTFAYVNAGTQLSKIESASGILSFNIIISFIILGLLPLIAKKVVEFMRGRKKLKHFKRPASFDYNLVVIGAGSAGLVSSYIASAVKAKVALIEKDKMGGDCLNTGCVPSKALIKSAKVLSLAKRAKEFGFDSAEIKFDFATVMDRVHSVIKKIEPHDSVERYSKLGVECIKGDAQIVSPYLVKVGDRTLTTRAIIIASGAAPFVPPISGLDKIDYLTSDTVWSIRELPKKLLVVGGGPIGVELAQTFSRLGSKVTLVQRGERILPKEDPEVSQIITEKFREEGITVLCNHEASEFIKNEAGSALIAKTEGGNETIPFDRVLLSLGRKARVTGFGLEELGIEVEKNGTVSHDSFLTTTVPNIYVCGDVAGPFQFTHTAAHQAWFASLNALLSPFWKFRTDYSVIPWCTFSDPEVARVGLSETEAKDQGIAYRVTTYDLSDLDRAIADGSDRGFIKVLTPEKGDKILGATIVGEHAGDLLIEFVSAMKHGLGLNKILGTIHIYPTLAEANKYTAGEWKRATASASALKLAEKFLKWQRK